MAKIMIDKPDFHSDKIQNSILLLMWSQNAWNMTNIIERENLAQQWYFFPDTIEERWEGFIKNEIQPLHWYEYR